MKRGAAGGRGDAAGRRPRVLDLIRTVDRDRLVNRLGSLDAEIARRVLEVLAELFAP
jgi:hypothetical protein